MAVTINKNVTLVRIQQQMKIISVCLLSILDYIFLDDFASKSYMSSVGNCYHEKYF